MPFCNKCGKELDADSGFCISCGAPAVKAGPPAYQVSPPFYEEPPAFSQPMITPDRNTFVNSYLGTVVLAAIFFGVFLFGIIATDGNLLNPRNMGMIFIQGICLLGPIAFATAVSTRAKGPDFSIGSVMAVSSSVIAVISISSGSPVLGIFISLLVCAAIGLLNGALITYLRAPAIIVTILTGILFRAVSGLILGGSILPASETIRAIAGYRIGDLSLGGLVILIVTFAAAFLMIMLTKLGVPTYKRDKKPALSCMFAYMASALISSAAGLYLMSRVGAASPIAGAGYEPFIALVFACIVGSRAMDNRFAPAVYAIAPVLLYVTFSNILSIIGLDVFWQTVCGIILAVIILAVAYVSRRFSSSYGND